MSPLADQVRPETLEQFVGQDHLVGANQPLRRAIETNHLFSFILWGPPGVGKTSLARIYSRAMNAQLIELSAVSAGKADIKHFIEKEPFFEQPKILFLDEIHRFTKAQQDYLLPFVERGELYLIGATTENPSFSVISALLSRLRVFVLEPLNDDQIKQVIGRTGCKMSQTALDWIVGFAEGDARQAIGIIEATQTLYRSITVDHLEKAYQQKFIRYDKQGDEHYNIISAFIKSMRASDPDAALYYLARMVEAGEDPLFIARRMVIFASEDIGMAQPTALVVANAVFQACQQIGYPEATINLAHGAVYLATAKKDRGAYNALQLAKKDVLDYGNLVIPLKLSNAPTKLMKELKYGQDYQMYPQGKESYLPDKIKSHRYYSKQIKEK
ncbi:MAG TPA: replication-associated recombination protein A [Candidatus Woesebacteria bacterium]|nr:replication-associated recombination protein A [Candidatus Woesebacteria bacterium]